jgi:prepilin-type N-terminal cleavage/methylation domain-containing protein
MARDARHQRGFTLPELLFVAAVAATLVGIAVPMFEHTADDMQTAMAARYLAGRIHAARHDALRRSAATALRFQAGPPDYHYTPYVDGNANGVRSADIAAGVDRPTGAAERLGEKFSRVRFGLLPDVPDADGVSGTGADGVRIGAARILTLSPDGTATSGTLYLHGRRAQYAVRVLGVTARTRVLKYDRGARQWITR